MKNKSFSSRMSWRIIGIVTVISLVAQIATAVVSQIIIAKEMARTPELDKHPWEILHYSPHMHIALIVIILSSFAVMFFVCRRVISRMSRPVELMESDIILARKIQMGMLRKDYPPYIYALLEHAREVGGDLYGFHQKGDQLYFSIGDVSGKGVPASLVMAITSAILRFVVELDMPLDETLVRINNSFAATNRTGMFATLFVARIDLKTGHMDYCNAGHNSILIIPPDAAPYFLKSKPNIAIGMFENFAYEAEQFDIKPNTRLVAYTDGVTEAERSDLSQYGNGRLMAWAKNLVETGQSTSLQEKDIVESLYASVKTFVNGNAQNDDITIASIKLSPKEMVVNSQTVKQSETSAQKIINSNVEIMTKKRFTPRVDKTSEIVEYLMASPDMPTDEALRFKIGLSVEEAVENVVRYAYDGGIGWLEAGTDLNHDSRVLSIELRDAGMPFNPLEKPDPDINLPANEREVGGLGIYLFKKLMDSISYRYEDGNNVLIMKKKLVNPGGTTDNKQAV